mgnify:CR=1 FL=1
MGLSRGEQVRYWGLATLVFLVFVWVMGSSLVPFLLGAAIAYLLDPLADWFEAKGFTRLVATAIITVMVAVTIALMVLLILPILANQLRDLIATAPGYLASLRDFLGTRFPELFSEGSFVRQGLAAAEDRIKDAGVTVIEGVLSSSLVLLDFVLIMVVAPVVSFYLLLDWDKMIARVDDLIPREHLAIVRRLARQIDAVLSGFVRGQLSVCAILGVFYAVALGLVGLQFGVFVGMFAGLMSFIPFVGAILGGVMSIGLAVVQFWNAPVWIGVVAGIFAFGQFVEGNVLTPNMV